MTLVVSVKVNDGVVLAADSATTMVRTFPDGTQRTINVYNNANKVLNLYKGLPLGVLTWGNGSVGGISQASLIKDFRQKLRTSNSNANLDTANYQVKDVAERFTDFVQDALANPFNGRQESADFYTGFIVAGYSTGSRISEEYLITLEPSKAAGPTLIPYEGKYGLDVGYGVYLAGQPEAAQRLIRGYGGPLSGLLDTSNYADPDIQKIITQTRQELFSELASPLMPVQDAVDLARFLLDLTIKYIRFIEGDQTVGGPVEIAAITKHEGFKWICRKYYFGKKFNPS